MWGGMCIDATARSKEPQQAESWPETAVVLQQVGNCRVGASLWVGLCAHHLNVCATLVSWHKSNTKVAYTHAQED